jgi:pimeloyl-ACP methyl ester carboxylesterase/DNA-binding CsgD family transcriptional regulator
MSGDARIAYQVLGEGLFDLVFVPGFVSNLDVHWEDAGYSRLLQRLSAFSRLILFDKRGTGLSDRVDSHHLPSLETRMDDVRAVMDATGSSRAALLGASEGAPMSILFAATYPERTRALILYGGYAHFHSWVLEEELLARFIHRVETSWGAGEFLPYFVPSRVEDASYRAWFARLERLSASPTAAIALARMNAEIDVRRILPSVRVPTLVIHRSGDPRVKISGGRYLAERIAGSRFTEIPGRDHSIYAGDVDRVADEIEEFLTGARTSADSNRVLATLMVGRLEARGRSGSRPGNRHSDECMDRMHQVATDVMLHYRGQSFGADAGQIAGRFDGPARAVRCALALRDAADSLELDLAAGIHVGEIEIQEQGVAGLAIHLAAQISDHALAGEILVSGVVTDLIAGSGLRFAERGAEAMEGLDFPLRLLAVAGEPRREPSARAESALSLEPLSVREREVLALVAEGLSNPAIARRLSLSHFTVKRHVANILLKLDMPTRAAAAAFMARQPRA